MAQKATSHIKKPMGNPVHKSRHVLSKMRKNIRVHLLYSELHRARSESEAVL
jgi:hypothetical protein